LFFSLASFVAKRTTNYQEQKNTQGFSQTILGVYLRSKIRCFVNLISLTKRQLELALLPTKNRTTAYYPQEIRSPALILTVMAAV